MMVSKGEATRNRILDEALTLASVVGLEGLSIGELAKATGMSKSGLFAHFDSPDYAGGLFNNSVDLVARFECEN